MPDKSPRSSKHQPARVSSSIRDRTRTVSSMSISPPTVSSFTKNYPTEVSSASRHHPGFASNTTRTQMSGGTNKTSTTGNLAKNPSGRTKSYQSTYNIASTSGRTDASGSESRKTIKEKKELSRKSRAECEISESTSHTQFFKKPRHEQLYQRITTDEFFGLSETLSGTSDSFRCVHESNVKVYSEKGLLKRNLIKELDPIPNEPRWTHKCNPAYGWDVAQVLSFLVQDPTVDQQKERLSSHLKDLMRISYNGFIIHHLNNICTIISYVVENEPKDPSLKEVLSTLLQDTTKPILLVNIADTFKYYDQLSNYLGFLGYLLIRLEDQSMFNLVSTALIKLLSMPDSLRVDNSVRVRHVLMAAGPVLYDIVVRMLAISSSQRFPTFQNIVLLFACNGPDHCIELMKRNVIENIFYRFNPYFPDRRLPIYDINPDDPHDVNVKLGDSTVYMRNIITILLLLLRATKDYLDKNPKESLVLPCPDEYAQRCFIWAFRYECRARHRKHERKTLVVVAHVLVHCFGARLKQFSEHLMPDILSLCVLTEIPPRKDWTDKVNFEIAQEDVQFKKLLIYFSVTLIKAFPHNRTMVESSYYLLGLMYLLDPELCYLRTRWAPSLFAELRKISLQALVCVIPRLAPNLVEQYGLIRRIMWYIEWYSESPYELPILYWCLRLLQVCSYSRRERTRQTTLRSIFDTHGIIVLIQLCYTLLEQKTPPVEKAQVIIALCLRLLTSAVENNTRVTCCVYPNIKWPAAINTVARRMLDTVLFSLDKHYIVSERWLVALLNFIWEGIIWKTEYRERFIARDGIYKLLDLITMTRAPVQCIAMALVCDATKAGDAVSQLITWRAGLSAAHTNPNVVKRGSTIATLLAAIFRDECQKTGVQLDTNGIIKDLDLPIMSAEIRGRLGKYEAGATLESPATPLCVSAAELAGSRLSKAYALLSMLSEDLEDKVSLADEAYKLYKNILLEPEDEAILVLCAHFLTLKLNEVWIAIKEKNSGVLQYDEDIINEFLHIGRGWAKDIKRQQEEVIKLDHEKQSEEENSLYEFLARVRLNMSLDALREVRCVARSADRAHMAHGQIQEAVRAHHRRALSVRTLSANIIRTYGPPLDDQNITGQNVKVFSIHPKEKPKPLEYVASSM